MFVQCSCFPGRCRPRGGSVFAQVLGELEQISHELIPGTFDAQRAVALFNEAARAERLCTAIKARLRAVSRRRRSGATAGIGAPHTGWPRRPAPPWARQRERFRRRVHSSSCQRPTQRSAPDNSPTSKRPEITSAAAADPSAEAELLEAAGATSLKGLRNRAQGVRAGAEADDRAWARRLHVERRAHEWTDPDGAYRFEGRLAPDAGARFSSACKAHVDRIFCDARRAGRREPRAAYAADALVALASEGPCKPVQVGLVTDSAPVVRGHTEPGERCEIVGIGPVPVTTARSLLDDSRLTVMVRDGDDITTVSSPKRTIPVKLRRALEAKYPTCPVKGCANDEFLELDHIEPLAKGGRTELANLWRPCSHHHALKTYAGWKVVRINGELDLVPPDDPDPP